MNLERGCEVDVKEGLFSGGGGGFCGGGLSGSRCFAKFIADSGAAFPEYFYGIIGGGIFAVDYFLGHLFGDGGDAIGEEGLTGPIPGVGEFGDVEHGGGVDEPFFADLVELDDTAAELGFGVGRDGEGGDIAGDFFLGVGHGLEVAFHLGGGGGTKSFFALGGELGLRGDLHACGGGEEGEHGGDVLLVFLLDIDRSADRLVIAGAEGGEEGGDGRFGCGVFGGVDGAEEGKKGGDRHEEMSLVAHESPK